MKKISVVLLLPALMAGGVATGQEVDSLDHYVEVALASSPAVHAAYHAYEAALQRARRAGALDDPVLEAGVYLEPMEYAGGREVARFQLMQMFPWFGTRRAARSEMTEMTRMAFEQFRESADRVREEVQARWYALCVARQRWLAAGEEARLLRQLERLAVQRLAGGGGTAGGGYASSSRGETPVATTASGGGMGGMKMAAAVESAAPGTGGMEAMGGGGGGGVMVEVLRLQVEIAAVEIAAEGLLSAIAAGKARFNALLNRPPGSEVAIPDTCLQVAFRLDVAAAARLVDLQNPMLGMLRAEEMARAAAAGMARKMGFPMIGVGVQYMVLGRLPGDAMGMGKMGGMDMVMPMVSVSIPLFRGKYRAARVENELAARESAARRDDALRELEAGLHDSRHALDEAARKIALARRQAALAGVTVELLTREFASGRGGIEEVLQARRQLVKFRLVGVEAVVEYNTRVAAVQRAISRPE